jgi:hypothetical protein
MFLIFGKRSAVDPGGSRGQPAAAVFDPEPHGVACIAEAGHGAVPGLPEAKPDFHAVSDKWPLRTMLDGRGGLTVKDEFRQSVAFRNGANAPLAVFRKEKDSCGLGGLESIEFQFRRYFQWPGRRVILVFESLIKEIP